MTLNTCPFCGSVEKPGLATRGAVNGGTVRVHCSGCGAEGPVEPYPTQSNPSRDLAAARATEAWNVGFPRRPPPNPWGFDGLMATAAVRYCLGRQTCIVKACADWIIGLWERFPESVREGVRRDVEEAFAEDDQDRADGAPCRRLGMDMDRKQWERVRALWAGKDGGGA